MKVGSCVEKMERDDDDRLLRRQILAFASEVAGRNLSFDLVSDLTWPQHQTQQQRDTLHSSTNGQNDADEQQQRQYSWTG